MASGVSFFMSSFISRLQFRASVRRLISRLRNVDNLRAKVRKRLIERFRVSPPRANAVRLDGIRYPLIGWMQVADNACMGHPSFRVRVAVADAAFASKSAGVA